MNSFAPLVDQVATCFGHGPIIGSGDIGLSDGPILVYRR
jgi:hypothetical protein